MTLPRLKIAGVPLTKIVAFVIPVLPLIGAIIHGYMYIEKQRELIQTLQDNSVEMLRVARDEAERQKHWLKQDEAEYERQETLRLEIRETLATIKSEQAKHLTILGDLERGHEYIARQQAEMVYRFGLHAGRHSVVDTMRRD